MTVIASYWTRGDWGGLQGGSGVSSRVADNYDYIPPDDRLDRSIRIECRDGDLAPWDSSLECAQVQGSSSNHPINTNRWYEWWFLYEQVAPWSSLDFHFALETHTTGSGTSAPWAENCTTSERQFRWTATNWNHNWPTGARTGLDLGNWHHYRVGVRNTTGTDGFYYFYRDDDLLYSQTGIRTCPDGNAWYPKIGWYRYGSCNGTDIGYVGGFTIHDTNPGYPGVSGGTEYVRDSSLVLAASASGADVAERVERGTVFISRAAIDSAVEAGREGDLYEKAGTVTTGLSGSVYEKAGTSVAGH